MSRRAALGTILLLSLLPAALSAWELSPKELPERVREATVIVLGNVSRVHSRKASPIMGVGDVWDVTLLVRRALKGTCPKTIHLEFVDATVKDRQAFRPDQERLWLLAATKDRKTFLAAGNYECVLLATDAAGVEALLRPAAGPRAEAPPRK